MFANSKQIRCSESVEHIQPISALISLSTVPLCIQRKTNNSFLYCDIKNHTTTNILSYSFDEMFQFSHEIVEQFMGQYQYSCFGDDHTFLINKEGDIVYYNHLTKDTNFIQTQHPSLFQPLQVHNIEQVFITCGGNVKNNQNQNEKIIKVWRGSQSELQMKSRIVSGHSKPIWNSLPLGRNKIVTLSTDKTIRSINLSTEQIQTIIPVSMSYYSGCQLDWNSVILGGIGSTLSIFDLRGRKLIKDAKLSFNATQVTKIYRLNSNQFVLANVNQLHFLDIRTLSTLKKGEYEGQRVSQIKSLGQNNLFVGNYDKTFQIWSCS